MSTLHIFDHVNMAITQSDVVSKQINDKIKSLINRPDRVILDLATGYNIYVIADQSDLVHLKKVQELLCNIKQGKTGL